MGVFRGYGGGAGSANPTNQAENITYDNDTSGLAADDLQAAIDEVEARIAALESSSSVGAAGPAAWLYGTGSIFTNCFRSTSVSTLTFPTGNDYYFAVICPRVGGTCTKVMLKGGTFASSYNVKLAIYRADAAGGAPGTMVVSATAGSIPAFSNVEEDIITTDFDYEANEVLWIGFKTQESTANIGAVSNDLVPVVAQATGTSVYGEVGYSVVNDYATNFASNPVLAGAPFISTILGAVPAVYFVIA